MAEEVFLEIVNHGDGLVKEFCALAAVHENSLCTEHLGHLGEDGCSALGHKPVGEFADKRICGNAAESVAASALESHAQLAYRHCLALVLRSLGVEVAQNLHTSLNLVAFHLLCDKELYAVAVVVTEQFLKLVRLVVLASKSKHKHTAGVGVERDVAQHLAGVLVVATELRASVIMMPGINGVDTLLSSLLAEQFSKTFGNTVHATHGRHNPYLVAHAHFAVFPYIPLERPVLYRNVKGVFHRLVRVGERTF